MPCSSRLTPEQRHVRARLAAQTKAVMHAERELARRREALGALRAEFVALKPRDRGRAA